MNGSVSVFVGNAVIHASIKKDLSSVDMSTCASPVQSAITIFGNSVDVSVPADKKLQNSHMSIRGSKMKGGSAITIGYIYTRTGLEERLQGSKVAAA